LRSAIAVRADAPSETRDGEAESEATGRSCANATGHAAAATTVAAAANTVAVLVTARSP
jgi:hypothetical protein